MRALAPRGVINADFSTLGSGTTRTSRSAGLVLLGHGELGRVLFAESAARPDSIDDIEAEVAPQRLLDDLGAQLVGPGGPHLGGAEHVFGDGGRPRQRPRRMSFPSSAPIRSRDSAIGL